MDARARRPYRPAVLEPLAEDLFTVTRPLRFLGVEVGARMTVVRLPGGGLFVHSPVSLDEETRAAVDALGPVQAIVAPNLYHHLYVGEWARAYPEATVSACPGLSKKRPDVTFTRTLGDDAPAEWRDVIEQVSFGALPMLEEVVFFHRRSSTLLTADLVFDLASHPSAFTRTVAALLGHRRPGPTLLERLMVRDRTAGRAQIDRILAFGAERVVLAHGPVIASGGTAVVKDGYAWL